MNQFELIKTFLPALYAARAYHRHEVRGIEHVPRHGPALLVVNHSLATYDIMLLMTAIYQETGHFPRALIDRLFFKVPFLGELMTSLGSVKGSPNAGEDLLRGGEVVTVAPGGMREALRPSGERYQIRWDKRYGFVKLAIKMGVPVILAACPRADDVYEVYPSYVTSWAYRTFRVPFFLARGVGPTPLPRPVKLIHEVSEPLLPPPWTDDEAELRLRVGAFHQVIVDRMNRLIVEAIADDP